MRFWRHLSTLILVSGAACSTEDSTLPDGASAAGAGGCSVDADCATPDLPLCDAVSGACSPLPPGHEIGWKDGSPSSVAFVVIHEPDAPRRPTDLAFNPAKRAELWIVNQDDDSVVVVDNPGVEGGSWQHLRDPAASHFMNRPPALAFGVESAAYGMTWATCGDDDNGDDFIGPSLFSADLAVFAKETPTGLGSHLDMLHSTTFCRGIAHVEGNVYWTFNSNKRSLDQYDFGEDHGPGNDDHADGKIYRYAEGLVAGVDGVPSHLIYNAEDRHLYVADTGNKRIVKLDTQSGTVGRRFQGYEPVKERSHVEGATVLDVVPPGTLEAPSGIEIHKGLLYVTDNATSRFYVFDMAGRLVRTLDTGFAPGSLAGLAFGPDEKLYFTDLLSGRAYRIDPLH